MKIDLSHPLANKVQVLDFMGHPITYIYDFDTVTEIASMYVMGNTSGRLIIIKDETCSDEKQGDVLRVSVKLPGAKLVYRDTGLPVEDQ